MQKVIFSYIFGYKECLQKHHQRFGIALLYSRQTPSFQFIRHTHFTQRRGTIHKIDLVTGITKQRRHCKALLFAADVMTSRHRHHARTPQKFYLIKMTTHTRNHHHIGESKGKKEIKGNASKRNSITTPAINQLYNDKMAAT